MLLKSVLDSVTVAQGPWGRKTVGHGLAPTRHAALEGFKVARGGVSQVSRCCKTLEEEEEGKKEEEEHPG
jgi:hypothetical protein